MVNLNYYQLSILINLNIPKRYPFNNLIKIAKLAMEGLCLLIIKL